MAEAAHLHSGLQWSRVESKPPRAEQKWSEWPLSASTRGLCGGSVLSFPLLTRDQRFPLEFSHFFAVTTRTRLCVVLTALLCEYRYSAVTCLCRSCVPCRSKVEFVMFGGIFCKSFESQSFRSFPWLHNFSIQSISVQYFQWWEF